MTKVFVDMLGREVRLPSVPKRIVSLVPSQTELLADWGMEEEVVGITKFCVHPRRWFQSKPRVGGTKNLNRDKIRELNPDLILANKEENEKEQIESLSAEFPVWISDIRGLSHALNWIQVLGQLLGKSTAAARLLDELYPAFESLKKGPALRVAYAIWKDPWIWVGGDNYIDDMLRLMGWTNVLGDRPRYPQQDMESVLAQRCDLVLLSSEPYPFREKHGRELAARYPGQRFRGVDGEMFSWYGSRLKLALPYMNELIQDPYGIATAAD